MKKLLSLVILILLLCSCAGQKGKQNADQKSEQKVEQNPSLAQSDEAARMCNSFSNLNLNGMLYTESFRDNFGNEDYRLRFVDFDSMKSAVVCSRPNCKHTNKDECTAFGMTTYGEPVIVDNNLFFFSGESEWDKDGKLHSYIYIWKADLDGSQRQIIETIEDCEAINGMVIKGDTAYFLAYIRDRADHTGKTTGYMKSSLCSYDFDNLEFTNHGAFYEGYNGGMEIVGEYNDGLYLTGAYREKPDSEATYIYRRFDYKTGEIGEWDMPLSTRNEEYDRLKPMFISGGIYGYMDGETSHIIDADGNELVLENYSISSSIVDIPINGYYFNTGGGDNEKDAYTAVDLKTGEILKINKKAVPRWHYVLTYHDGNYIVYGLLGGNDFKKVSEDELFIRDEEK